MSPVTKLEEWYLTKTMYNLYSTGGKDKARGPNAARHLVSTRQQRQAFT